EFALRVVSPDSQSTATRNPRTRRLAVFSSVFFPALALGLICTAMQPAEYRAMAHLQIVPGLGAPPPADNPVGATTGADTRAPAERGSKPFLTEVQVLTSRPLVEEVVGRLAKFGNIPPDIKSHPVDGVQRMLSTETVEGTEVVLLRAEGPQPQFLAQLVNTLTSVYREHLASTYQKSTGTGGDQLRDSVRTLDQKMAAKRHEVEEFRSANDIVSAERDENQLLSAAKGLASALNEAKGKLAAAEGQLRAARNGAA